MKTLTVICFAFALSGCATIENRVATYVISRYVGVWTKDGSTPEDMYGDSSRCIIAQAGRPYDEKTYRTCMTDRGWALKPFVLK